jgi:hypothetical protein
MMKLAVTCVALSLLAQPVSALRPANLTEAERRQIGYDYAKCIVEKHTALAKQYVLDAAHAGKSSPRFAIFSDFECIPTGFKRELNLRMGTDGMVYNFSEVLMKRENVQVPTDFAAVPFLSHGEPMKLENYKRGGRLSKEAYARNVANSQNKLIVAKIGECTVRGDGANAAALLQTGIGSNEEKAAMQAILPMVSKCIESGSIKLLPEQIRGSVAYNLYRLSYAAAETSKVKMTEAVQ